MHEEWCWLFEYDKEKQESVSFKRKGGSSPPGEGRKQSYAEVTKIHGKNKSSTHEIMKKKEICNSFAVAPQAAKVTATVCVKCLVKMEKALHLYNKVFLETDCILITFITVYCYNLSILLLVIVVNLWRCQMEVKFYQRDVYTGKKKCVYTWASTIPDFRHLLGALECILHE